MDQWRPPFLHVTLSRFSKYEIIRWLWTWKVWSWKFRFFTLFHQNFSSKFSISKFIRILIPRIFEIRHSDRNFETRWLNIWNRWRHRWNQLWFHFGRIWIKKFDFWCHKMNKKWFWLKMKELEKRFNSMSQNLWGRRFRKGIGCCRPMCGHQSDMENNQNFFFRRQNTWFEKLATWWRFIRAWIWFLCVSITSRKKILFSPIRKAWTWTWNDCYLGRKRLKIRRYKIVQGSTSLLIESIYF